MRQVLMMTGALLAVCMLGACAQKQTVVEDPTLTPRKGRVTTCKWMPVAPEWNEPCTHQNQGAKLEVTMREDSRPESAQKQTATCECD